MGKKLLFPLISGFLAYQTYKVVVMLWLMNPAQPSLYIKILFAVVINLFATGVFAFMGFAYKTNRLLPSGYYEIKYPKTLVRFSNGLGVQHFKKLLLVLFWGSKKNRKKYFDGSREGLVNFDFQTRQSEFGHMLALMVIQLLTIPILMKGHYQIALFTTVLNFISNFYPVLLQRTHRVQLNRIKKVMDRKR